jgi:transposase, IS30 family
MEKRKRFIGLSSAERSEISILRKRGWSMREIATALGRSPNTVSYEIKHNSVTPEGANEPTYDPQKAKQKARVSRRSRRYQWRKIEHYPALRAFVVEKLETHDWSPDAIAGHLKHEQSALPTVGKDQIYAWLYSSRGQAYCQHLLSKRYSPKRHKENTTERTMIPDRVSITERPPEVAARKKPGHWEGDTVVSGKRTGGKAALAVLQERMTRFLAVTVIPNLKPASFTGAATAMLTDKQIHTLSLDNGIENKQHAGITSATGAGVYFCDPYSSWQKGGVENANKMLRRYVPKGCDISRFTQAQIDDFVATINNKPRRCLGYKSALQLAKEKGLFETVVS